jgi:pyrrolidone-carboxylate peptidase
MLIGPALDGGGSTAQFEWACHETITPCSVMSGPVLDPDARETPRLLLAGFGGYAQAPDNPAALIVERLSAQRWSPAGAALSGCIVPVSWTAAPAAVIEAARARRAHAVLLLAAVAQGSDFRVEMRAQNRASRRRADADGRLWGEDRILPTGPGVVRATAPVAEMVQAIKAAGCPVRASSDSGDFIGNFTFYRLLAELCAEGADPAVGCLAIPARIDLDLAERAVKAAAEALGHSVSASAPEPVSA